MLSNEEFMKIFKKNIFKTNKYFADKMYPGTIRENKKYINEFNKKYKRKFLYDYPDKDNNLTKEEYNFLFEKSISFISFIQKNMMSKYNIENYISGGTALHIYLLTFNKNTLTDLKPNSKPNTLTNTGYFSTTDIDTYLYLDEPRIVNINILKNIVSISDIIVEYKLKSFFAFIDLYVIFNFKNTTELFKIIAYMLSIGFDLFKYNFNEEITRYNFVFIKMIQPELCLKITVRFQSIELFLKEKIYSYVLLKYYYIYQKSKKEFKSVHKIIPIEFLVKYKKKSNISFMKSKIHFHHHDIYIYNMKTLLYNLLHLNYKYLYNKENKTIEKKKSEGKNIRDKKRLDIFFSLYCKYNYPNLNSKNRDIIYKKMIQNDSFKISIEKIKDLSIIDSFLSKKVYMKSIYEK